MSIETQTDYRNVVLKAGLGGTVLGALLFLGSLYLLSQIVQIRGVDLSPTTTSALSALAFLALCTLPSLCSVALAYLLARPRKGEQRRTLVLQAALAPLALIPLTLSCYTLVSILAGLFRLAG